MFNYFLYRFGQALALTLPIKMAYALAIFISDLHYMFNFTDRRNVRSNLKAIFPDKNENEIHKIRRQMFRNFAKYLADFFRFTKIDKKYIQEKIQIKNIHYLDQALANGKGAIILTAHLGNWELGGVVLGLLGYPFYAVALPHKHKKVDDFFNFQRESKGVKVIPLGKAVKTSLNILKENKLLALVGDREFTRGGITVNLFGKLTAFPKGPAALSLKTGSLIIPGFMVRNADDSFTLQFEKPIEGQNYSLNALVDRYKIIIEEYIRRYPDQWYMFRRFWTEN